MPNLRPRDWDIRVKIWQCQARGDNIMATLRHFEIHAGEEGYPMYVPDRGIISKIRSELLTLLERLPEMLPSLPPEVQAYVINKRPDLKDKIRFVDLHAEDACSYRDYILKITGQPYRNRHGVLVVTTDVLGRLRESPG
ncbi:MAG: hypothetical protein MUO97_12555 [Dehalococcoidia bacterium]|jgi:hypothetical protein|nr:hypothetical protein [Dehalococcoidia bacterium]